MTSAPPASQSATSSKVLKCLDCDFVCLSNNQMCRHIFQTCHTLVTCSQCNVRLVSWGFSPGVKKLFDKARKDGVLLEDFTMETAEKHFEATQHQNSNVPAKENFVVQGPPEAFGLQPTAARPDPLNDPSSVRFRCPDCANIISTWTQMTRHLDATKHSLARCAECSITLKCYGPAQPQRHEKMTGHRGIVGIFRQKADYAIHPLTSSSGSQSGHFASCSKWQTHQYRCFCGIAFLHPLYLADHLVCVHEETQFPHATCLECGADGPVSAMITHMHTNEAHNDFDIPDLHADDYLIAATGGCIIHRDVVTSVPDVSIPGTGGREAAQAATSSYRILYQCPDCLVIFTSWCRLEGHLTATRHGLCFCVQCNQYLRPRGGSESHTAITGHSNVVREHLSRRDYEVLVDLDDAELVASIEPPTEGAGESVTTQTVYQCPMPSCLAVYCTAARLEEHFSSTRHATVTCPECFGDVVATDAGGIAGHAHPIEAPEYLQRITCLDDLLVSATDEQLALYFSEECEQCERCHRAVPRGDMLRHVKSSQCLAAAAPLDLTCWGAESTSQPTSGHGSIHITPSQQSSIGVSNGMSSSDPKPTQHAGLPSQHWQWSSTPSAAIGPSGAGAAQRPPSSSAEVLPPTSPSPRVEHFVWAPSIS